MPELVFDSPVGWLTLVASGCTISSLEWRKSGASAKTKTLLLGTKELAQYFSGGLTEFTVPCDPQGTPFQRRVWGEIVDIPYGELRTYRDIAQAVKSSPRAVGGACGRNPIPIIIPCHRVVGSTGNLTGYTGANGINTKSFLLEHESRTTQHLGR